MSRYIDKDALKYYGNHIGDEYEDYFHETQWVYRSQIDSAPSIDIVFCKECKHRINDDDFQEKHICLLRRANGGKFCRDNDFCSYGERDGE